ncbi:chorismate mutase [Streptococcus halichoeri]|uniref:chorismate mutase n=1 Tax=Streptococcus halichoeri TaxID=254785 RepID=UPI000DB82C19|nr:chorismate mutase [Streptococcus halichoeri]PZO94148.1 MAG: chorismate mutase [Streptococcus pyogenes]
MSDQLQTVRKEIDQLNIELVSLLEQRMYLVQQVLDYKRKQRLPILDQAREARTLEKIADEVHNKAYQPAILESFQAIMAASRHFQDKIIEETNHA